MKLNFYKYNFFRQNKNYFIPAGRGHRSSLNGTGGRTKSSKSRRERGEDRGTPYDSSSSSNPHRGSRRRSHHNNTSGSSSSIMGGNVSSKLSKLKFKFNFQTLLKMGFPDWTDMYAVICYLKFIFENWTSPGKSFKIKILCCLQHWKLFRKKWLEKVPYL